MKPGAPARVLLTGATGFLGAFLLRELLDQTDAEILCLVRAADEGEGGDRLRASLERHGLRVDAVDQRVVPVCGDLSLPRLGLSEERFARLADKVDAIHHNGARVNWVRPYSALEAVNVQGTREVLRLATQGRPTPVHHTSTVAVFPFGRHEIAEDAPLDHNGPLYGGYPQTKLAAEKLVAEAAAGGLPATRYRPGMITGDVRTGLGNPGSYLETFIRGCVQLGSFPTIDNMVDMSPVDYVARALVAIALQTRPGGVYHLVNPHPIHTNDLAAWVRGRGYPLRELPFSQWRQQLLGAPDFKDNPLYPFGAVLAIASEEQLTFPRLLAERTLAATTAIGIQCPPVDDALLGRYFDAYIRAGLLPPPAPSDPPLEGAGGRHG